jgi:hypothetical protein
LEAQWTGCVYRKPIPAHSGDGVRRGWRTI